jgi:phosphoglycolate phosphatase
VSSLLAFDLDGTLEDSREDMVAAARRVRAALALPARADAALLPHVNKGMDALYRVCFDDALSRGMPYEDVRRAYDDDYLAHVADRTKAYPGIPEALAEIAPLGTLAVVTNKPEKISRALLDALGIGKHFRTVVGGDSCAEIKPSALVMKTAAERCGFDLESGRAIVTGDTDGDVTMGHAVGAKTVWCAWGYVEKPKAAPHAIARSPGDLPGVLRELLRT